MCKAASCSCNHRENRPSKKIDQIVQESVMLNLRPQNLSEYCWKDVLLEILNSQFDLDSQQLTDEIHDCLFPFRHHSSYCILNFLV